MRFLVFDLHGSFGLTEAISADWGCSDPSHVVKSTEPFREAFKVLCVVDQ